MKKKLFDYLDFDPSLQLTGMVKIHTSKRGNAKFIIDK
jgi:hypothetical protein